MLCCGREIERETMVVSVAFLASGSFLPTLCLTFRKSTPTPLFDFLRLNPLGILFFYTERANAAFIGSNYIETRSLRGNWCHNRLEKYPNTSMCTCMHYNHFIFCLFDFEKQAIYNPVEWHSCFAFLYMPPR